MKKSSAVLVTCIFIAGLIAAGFAIRSMINFGEDPHISEYIPEARLTGMIYDLLYFYGWVIIGFLGLALIMLLYLILMVESLIEAAAGQSASKKAPSKARYKRKKPVREKTWPPQEEPD